MAQAEGDEGRRSDGFTTAERADRLFRPGERPARKTYTFIAEQCSDLPVSACCRVIGVSRWASISAATSRSSTQIWPTRIGDHGVRYLEDEPTREPGYREQPRKKNGPALAGYGAVTMKNAPAESISTPRSTGSKPGTNPAADTARTTTSAPTTRPPRRHEPHTHPVRQTRVLPRSARDLGGVGWRRRLWLAPVGNDASMVVIGWREGGDDALSAKARRSNGRGP
jgi:hypothetical protein